MLTIDGTELDVLGWERRAQEAGLDVQGSDIIRRFIDLRHGAHESVFAPVDRRPSCTLEAMVDRNELADLLAAWRSR